MPTKYTPTEVDKALTVLAYCGGNGRRAERICGVPQATLYLWRSETHRDRYQEIQERERPKLEQLAVDGAVAQILRADESTLRIYDRIDEGLDGREMEIEGDDGQTRTVTVHASAKELAELAGAAQRLTTAKGINGTKLLELTGRPTQITEHRSATDTLRSLAQRFPGLIVDAEATEIPPEQALIGDAGQANARSER